VSRIACIGLLAILGIAPQISATDRTPVYFFKSAGCPHCAQAEPVLRAIAAAYNLDLHELEVTQNRDFARQYLAMAERFGFKARSVPAVFIGKRYWVGYTPEIGEEIRSFAAACNRTPCGDAATLSITGSTQADPRQTDKTATAMKPSAEFLDVPLLGRVSLAQGSLWTNTTLIAFVDGFNPCSLWVLTMLMALVIHTGSRGKVFLIGFVFLTVTSLVYVGFIAGLFSLVQLIGFVSYVRIAMAALTLVMGIINIKDYFFLGKGISLTIAPEKKPGILARMRNVVLSAGSVWPMVTATVVLAAGVSFTEFSCTAGFPVLWVNLIASQNVSSLEFGLLLALYMLIYQLDELVIFLTVVFTLRIGRFQEKQGRLLKLFGGVLMLTLAAVLLAKPALLENIGASVAIFTIAFAVAGLVLLAGYIHRQVSSRRGKDQP
jgi:glutaredoxin